jgi:DNA-directed RNA polymerase specialized sigma24 family protein
MVERGAESPVRDLALNPKQDAVGAQGKQIALQTLDAMPARDREALIRFYLQEQTAQEIEAAMDMTDTQFRLIKSGARKRFAELQHRTAGLGLDPGGNPAISLPAISNRQRDPVPARA